MHRLNKRNRQSLNNDIERIRGMAATKPHANYIEQVHREMQKRRKDLSFVLKLIRYANRCASGV